MAYDYEHFWDVYRDTALYNPSQKHRRRLIVKEVTKIIRRKKKDQKSLKVLDVGCGMGYLIHELYKRFPEVQYNGIDISISTIEGLKQRFPHATWLTRDVQKPIDDSQYGLYDIVICSEVLEHCEEHGQVAENLIRLAAPGGSLVITVPGGSRYRVDDDIGHLRHYTLEDVHRLFGDGHMERKRSYRWGFPFLNLMRFLSHVCYPVVDKYFVNTTWNWQQLVFCQCLYSVMFVTIPRFGCQLVCVFDKKK